MMEVTTRLKRKRVSKNKKKSWRKHTDIADVEEALDDERLQLRTGGLVAEKPDDSLFFVDKATEQDAVAVKHHLRPLKCYANLEPDPYPTPFITSQNKQKTKKVKKKGAVKERKTKTQVIAEEQRRKALRQRKLRGSLNDEGPQSTYDLWEDKPASKDPDVTSFHLEYTKKRRVQPPSHYHEKTSALPAVDVPHPGASYNPAYDDHQELLMKALQTELIKEKKDKKLERALDAQFPSKNEAPTQESWLEEMSAGLFDEEGEGDDGSSGNDDDRISVNPAVRRENKKTRRQRRIEKERKDKEKAHRLVKEKKLRAQELFRIKSIRSDLKTRAMELERRKQRKAELKEIYKDKPKKLGKLKYEEPEVEIKLTDELAGSLRELKPEGHLLEDRFKALQRRNIIEPRKRAKFVRKYKRKKFEKKGHKAVTVD